MVRFRFSLTFLGTHWFTCSTCELCVPLSELLPEYLSPDFVKDGYTLLVNVGFLGTKTQSNTQSDHRVQQQFLTNKAETTVGKVIQDSFLRLKKQKKQDHTTVSLT